MNMWALPSSRRFIQRIAEKMTDGQFCVVILPETLDTNLLVKAFEQYAYQEELGVCDIVDAIPDLALARSLCRTESNVRDNAHIDIDELMDTPVSGSFLIVKIPSSECEAARTLAATLRELAASTKRRKDASLGLHWTLLVVTPAVLPLPESDIGLEILYWQGIWRKADVEMVFDECIRLFPPACDALGWWLYSLSLGLAMTDPTLCSELFQKPPLNMVSIVNFCNCHPVARAADLENKNLLISCDNSISTRPGPIRRESAITGEEGVALWAKGFLDRDESGGLVLHPAVLAQSKRNASLERMICHGQQQVFLPLQQRVLRHLHRRIAEICGSDWHKKSFEDTWKTVTYDIGPLPLYIKTFLRFCPAGIQDAAEAWRDVRHTVAHNTFLPFEKFRIAMDTLERL